MESLASLTPLANIVVALVALFSGLGLIFNWLLSPVKDNQIRMEKVLADIQKVLGENQRDLADNQRALADNQRSLAEAQRALADNKQHINRVELTQQSNTAMLQQLNTNYSSLQKTTVEIIDYLKASETR